VPDGKIPVIKESGMKIFFWATRRTESMKSESEQVNNNFTPNRYIMSSSNLMIEIFTINLKPGTRDKFHQLYMSESLPLQKKWKIKVVAYGPSLHDEDSYYVIRSFKNLEDRQQTEDAFYGSD
jgi:hypothetical protein